MVALVRPVMLWVPTRAIIIVARSIALMIITPFSVSVITRDIVL